MNSSEKKTYDLTNLNELCSLDEAIVKQLVLTFITSTPALFKELEKGLEHQSLSEINEANHQLKSAFLLFQVTDGTRIVLAIEEQIKNTTVNFEKMSTLTSDLGVFIQSLISDLQKDLNLS
jgi:HPt (histidine-containing phosphotransfer) domain-containing protein